jgi:hypothetical protein
MFRNKLQINYTHSGSFLSFEKESIRMPLEFGVFFFHCQIPYNPIIHYRSILLKGNQYNLQYFNLQVGMFFVTSYHQQKK